MDYTCLPSQPDLTKSFCLTIMAIILSNSYTMGCLPVRRDNPRALASGLSYVHAGKHGITILNHQHAHHDIFHA